MAKKSKPVDDDEFVDDALPMLSAHSDREGVDVAEDESDSDFPQQPVPGGDPEATEFRDALSVTPNVLGISSALEEELDAQRLEQEQATIDALEAMRALDHGETIEWKISRVGEDDEQYNGFLVTWSNSQMSLERIQRLLGGGKYHCKGFRRGKYFTHKVVKIAGPPLLKKGDKPVESGQGGGDMQAFMQQMMMMDERRRREDEQRRHDDQERQDRKEATRQQLILSALPSVATVLAAMFQGNRTDLAPLLLAMKPPPPPDPMQQLAALKALMPEPAPPAPNALDSAFTLVDKLKDMGGLNGGDQAGWMDILKEVVKAAGPSVGTVIEGAVQSAQAAAAARQQAAPARGLQDPSVTVIPAPIDTSQAGPARISQEGQPVFGLLKHLPFLRSHLNRWVLAAAKNAPPALYAQVFFTEAPDDMDPRELMELLSREDWLQQLAKLDGRVAQLQPWFHALHDVLVNTLRADYLNVGGAGAAVDSSGGGTPTAAAAVPAPSAARRVSPGEIERPMKLPSMTGD